jgi:hypothetical protein
VVAVERHVQVSTALGRPAAKTFRVVLQRAPGIRRAPDLDCRLNLARLRVSHHERRRSWRGVTWAP